jgi:hypothetical protein
VNTAVLPLNVTPLNVSVTHNDKELKVVWPEDPPHVSVYSADWLDENAYWTSEGDKDKASCRDAALDKRGRVLFDASTFRKGPDGGPQLPVFHHDMFMSSDETLFEALKCVSAA